MNDILFSHISKTYSRGIVALDDFSATIPFGKLTAFIGSNGSGKSTALKLLAGHLKPESGTINFLGIDPQKKTEHIRKRIAFVSQDVDLDPDVKAKETLLLIASLYGLRGAEKQKNIRRAIQEYGLESHLKKKVKSFSGGLKQRLNLALSTIHDPAYLLLDEPDNSLDSEGKVYLWEKISSSEGTAIIVTHDLKEAAHYCDHVVLFHKGRLLAEGSPKEVISKNKSMHLQFIYRGSLGNEFEQALEQMEGIHKASVWKDQVILSIDENEYSETKITTLFDCANAEIIEKREHQPDLFTAYFHLSGTIAMEKTRNQNLKKGRGKKR